VNHMDFNLLPPIDGMDIFVRLDPAIENRFEQLSTLDEAWGKSGSDWNGAS
jgi:hypothetical protein